MLRELAVRNLAVIEDVRVELHHGFCVWTGETGAGKSLLLGALGLLLGERGSADLIRTGADELRVTGRFDLTNDQRIAASEIAQVTLEDDLIVARRLSRSGKSTALVNEQPVAVATLRKLGDLLVDVHGQRDSYSLLQPACQLDLLDAFGKLGPLRAKYSGAADVVRDLRKQQRQLTEAKHARQRELSLVRFERDELMAANLLPGELANLEAERQRLTHARSLAAFTQNVASKLYDDDGSVVEVLGSLLKPSQQWAKIDASLKAVASRLEALQPELQDLAETCRDLSDTYAADPERLDNVESRLDLLAKLESKYGKDTDALIVYRDNLDERAASLQQQESELGDIERMLKPAFESLKKAAEELSRKRASVAKKFISQVQEHLADLQMPKATLDASLVVSPLGEGDVPAAGVDTLELLLSANPGEPPRPLRKVASGGELSRTMLALKTVLAAHDPVRTLVVFDEIDANVGGRLGDVLGAKLAELGKTHQVLCVTHLPQVAGYAKAHWTIRKCTTGKKTTTTITPLSNETERIEELAMMLRGESRSETTRKEAGEMLKKQGNQSGIS